jgi:hypothetical protein
MLAHLRSSNQARSFFHCAQAEYCDEARDDGPARGELLARFRQLPENVRLRDELEAAARGA